MKLILAVLALLSFAAPARADSDVFFVSLSSLTSTGSAGAVVSTATALSHPLTKFSISVKGNTVTASSWDVRLEGSLDGAGWTTLVYHSAADGDGTVKGSTITATTPVTWLRARVNALSLGSANGIQIKAIGSQ